jgi:MoaA/NifB/PqqE/SkfB family radical SAM enzyme
MWALEPGPPRSRDVGDPVRTKSDVTVTLACNNHCPFCPRSTLEHIRVGSEDELRERLSAVRQHSTRVVLTGGEVTIRPDFVALVAHCRELGFEHIGVISNGRRFADADLARQALEAGLTEACVTVYDNRPAVHDALTAAPGSLLETLAGLDNLLALARDFPAFHVRVNTLLCASNASGLHGTLRDLTARGVRRFLVAEVLLSEAFDQPVEHGRVVEIVRAVVADPALAHVTLHWRGLPLCLLSEVPGADVEAHEIDTAIIGEEEEEAYFGEFFQNFTHVEACDACVERHHCLGLQKRYVKRFGSEHVAPFRADQEGSAIEAARSELESFPPWPESGRLEVVATTNCPFRCRYCAVTLGPRHAAPEVLDRAVDLLLTAPQDRLELQFFGGEPLLRRDEMIRTMTRATAEARQLGKDLHFCITTNGLLLDADLLQLLRGFAVKIMFSFDGPPDVMERYRSPKRARALTSAVVEQNLRRLVRSGLPYFVNMVVTPEAVGDLPRRLRHVMDLGAQSIQICYALGPGWTEDAQAEYVAALEQCALLVAAASRKVRLQNLGSAAEPTVLSNDLIVDVDGTVYGDAAIFGEKVLPGLRRALRLGNVFELESIDGLRRTREQNLVTLRRAYPVGSEQRALLEQQLSFGGRVQKALGKIERKRPASDRNPLQAMVLRRGLTRQAEVMRARPELLALPILMLENACYHDCLFCLPKPLAPTPFDEVARWLADNRTLGLSRLGIAGNEPLAHPDIDRILERARQVGFSRFDVLSSGAPLADPERARALVEAGVRGYAFPLHADDPAVHDAITQTPGSHAATVRAIENLLALGAEVHVHANLLRQNLDSLAALEARVVGEWKVPFCVIPVRAKSANLPYAELMPRYRDVVARARVGNLLGFPLCVADQVQDPAIPSASVISDVLKLYVLDQPFLKPPKCRDCRWFKRCSGSFQAYLDLYGDEELTPR